MLILFAPGPPREEYLTELADIRTSGRTMTNETGSRCGAATTSTRPDTRISMSLHGLAMGLTGASTLVRSVNISDVKANLGVPMGRWVWPADLHPQDIAPEISRRCPTPTTRMTS